MSDLVPATTMLAGYELQEGTYDEAFEPGGQPRPQYAAMLERLDEIDLAALGGALTRELRERRITFGASADGMVALDPVPRILTAAEWRQVADGVVQRARALERFVADVYGERAASPPESFPSGRSRARPTGSRACEGRLSPPG